MALPALFLSLGAPKLALEDGPARRFWQQYGNTLGKPAAILVLSAHFDTPAATLTAAAQPGTIHDFGGFPQALYQLSYPAPGAPALAGSIAGLLQDAGITTRLDTQRGLDHGAWVPLLLLYPDADVPVLQLAIDTRRGPDYHLQLGEILRPLREQNILIIGSGSATHNLGEFFRGGYRHDSPAPGWVTEFGDWAAAAVQEQRSDDLLHYRERAPHAVRNHPSEEHFLPLFSALGAATPGQAGRRVHHSHTYGVLAMDVYAFD
jgi:4,5-DOPA dioxygenase extradiol